MLGHHSASEIRPYAERRLKISTLNTIKEPCTCIAFFVLKDPARAHVVLGICQHFMETCDNELLYVRYPTRMWLLRHKY